MARVATQRLIEAAAALDPTSRALLNLWVHRGLPDAALARMAGVPPEAIIVRRLDLVDQLSRQLGLPPYEILAALREIAPTPQAPPAPTPQAPPAPTPQAPPAPTPQAPPAPAPQAAPAPRPNAPRPKPPARGPRRSPPRAKPAEPVPRRAPRPPGRVALIAALSLVLVAAVLVLVAVLDGGGGGAAPRRALARREHNPAAVTSVPGPGSPDAAVRPRPLRPLSAGPSHAGGEVSAVQKGGARELVLTITGLPAAVHGHYEVWLFNSIVDSRPLGAVRGDTRRLRFALPPGAGRFRWIDVSFQPPGFADDSGESVLRARNPAAM